MVIRRVESKVSIESGLFSQVALKTFTGTEEEMPTTAPGRKLFGCVALSFCLLCILQVALNIYLRLAHFSEPGIVASCRNETEDRDDLRRNNFGTEEHCKNLTAVTDDLKRELKSFDLQLNSLNKVRDELRRQLNDFVYYLQEGWIYFSGSFYLISSFEKTWQESRDDCLQRGAHLVIINSKAEQEFTRQHQKILWIGLSDTETEGVWTWVDGSPLTTSFWRDGEPNNFKSRNEDCVATKFYDYGHTWNDEVCENKNLWICEKEINP